MPRQRSAPIKYSANWIKLPADIERLETDIGAISEQMNQPDFYQAERSVTAAIEKNLATVQEQLNHCYQRWEELETE